MYSLSLRSISKQQSQPSKLICPCVPGTPPYYSNFSLKEPALVIKTVIDGLQAYFDRALGNQLLYRFERPQYADIRKKYFTGQEVVVGQTEKEMSYIYGAEHLLRMMGEFQEMINS